jgi:hypothetical protein
MGTIANAGGTDDGVDGSTQSHDRNGLFGFNADTSARNAANPGGNGVFGFTQVPDGAGVFGAHNTGGIGVAGIAQQSSGVGVSGFSPTGDGIWGRSQASAKSGVFGLNESTAPSTAPGGSGVFGLTMAPGAVGVFGSNNSGTSGRGVQGNGPEVGVGGFSIAGVGVAGWSNGGDGTQGFTGSSAHNAVLGRNTSTAPLPNGGAPAGNGVFGFTDNPHGSGVVGATGPNSFVDPNSHLGGAGVTGIGKLAGQFFGDVTVTGHVHAPNGTVHCFDVALDNGDCAEEFDLSDGVSTVEPGTVVCFDDEAMLRPSAAAYDKRVAGVISGAGEYRPGIVLDKKARANRSPVALLGKVVVKADADYGPIEVGDLLTTSATAGHAMKVTDPVRALGTVIGKALQPLGAGTGMVRMLVTLK